MYFDKHYTNGSILTIDADHQFVAKTALGTGGGLAPKHFGPLLDVTGDGAADVCFTYTELKPWIGYLVVGGHSQFTCDSQFGGCLKFVPFTCPDIAGDFNADGKYDIVVGGEVFYRNADDSYGGTNSIGAFPPHPYGSGKRVAADLNADGIPDLVTANGTKNSASVLLGTGGTGFKSPTEYSAGLDVLDVAVRDMNGDEFLDILTLNSVALSISILLNDGKGAFNLASTAKLSKAAKAFGVTDLGLDGDLDIFTDDEFVTNQGGLVFAPPVAHAKNGLDSPGQSGEAQLFHYADFDGDGNLDIARARTTFDYSVAVVRGKANGTFDAAVALMNGSSDLYLPLGPTDGSHQVSLADLNGDGLLELVAPGPSGVAIASNLGNGLFGSFALVPGTAGASAVEMLDVEGDGDLDLVASQSSEDTILIIKNDGSGTFGVPVSSPTGAFSGPTHVSVGDLNKDGLSDVVTANSKGGTLSVFINSNGALSPKVGYAAGVGPLSIAMGDLNGDGSVDLVSSGANHVRVLMGDGTGTFGSEVSYATGPASRGVALVDIDGDGALDIYLPANEDFFTLAPKSGELLLNTGSGTFGSPQAFGSTGRLLDLDQDGKLDLLAVYDNAVVVRGGLGNGKFRAPKSYVSEFSNNFKVRLGRRPVVADLDGDGLSDVVVNGDLVSGLRMLRGRCL